MRTLLLASLLACSTAFAAHAQTNDAAPAEAPETEMQSDMSSDSGSASMATASAELMGADGTEHGTVEFQQTATGVLVTADLTDVPAGVHGFHIHETGSCEPDFQAAGGHFAGDMQHGYMVNGGPHPGDMPNIHVSDSGSLMIEVFNPNISLTEGEDGYLFDDDGSAMMIHAGEDDYESQPSGDAGDRIACGVIEMSGQ